MEENLRTNIPVPLPDREAEATDNCESESTRTESIDSGITVGSSGDFLSHNADASESTGWTDEKHSLYLNHLETSFVKQLHRSAGLCGWHSRTKIWGPFSSYGTRPRTHNSADQYTVLQDGCWQKVNFGENGPLLDQRSDSYTGLDNQWIHHFTSSSKQRIGAPPSLHESILARDAYWRSGSSRNSQEPGYDQYHDVSVDSTTEVSDQNFVDNDGESSNRPSSEKRLKRATAGASSSDQVVPHRKFQKINASSVNHALTEKDAQELLSDEPESFACQKDDLHYYLRGS